MTAFTDYRFKVPALADAAAALAALQAAGLVSPGDAPVNMLGCPVVVTVGGLDVTIRAARGRPARDTVVGTLPAAGDPAFWYLAVRTEVPPGDVPFDPTTLGLVPCDPAESAAVLGVWA